MLRGRVTDEAGAILSGAFIHIHWDPTGGGIGLHSNPDPSGYVLVRAGSDGTFTVKLKSGFYDVMFSMAAFSPVCKRIRVKENRTLELSPKLKVDPWVLKH